MIFNIVGSSVLPMETEESMILQLTNKDNNNIAIEEYRQNDLYSNTVQEQVENKNERKES